MSIRYTDLQLDALRELANIASGMAATALSQLLEREVGLSVPRALALPLADAVDAAGPSGITVCAVAIPLGGDIEGLVLLLIPPQDAATLCRMLGVEPGSEVGDSALSEIGNILGTSYLNALVMMTGLELAPRPPHFATDLLGAIVASMLAHTAGPSEMALVLDSELDVAGEPCSISFLLLPTTGGADELLARLGLTDATA